MADQAEEDRVLPAAEFGGPASYRIVVGGPVSPRYAQRLGGFRPSAHGPSAGGRAALLGRVQDQAELSGVLRTLHALKLTIVSVERVEDEPLADARSPTSEEE